MVEIDIDGFLIDWGNYDFKWNYEFICLNEEVKVC